MARTKKNVGTETTAGTGGDGGGADQTAVQQRGRRARAGRGTGRRRAAGATPTVSNSQNFITYSWKGAGGAHGELKIPLMA